MARSRLTTLSSIYRTGSVAVFRRCAERGERQADENGIDEIGRQQDLDGQILVLLSGLGFTYGVGASWLSHLPRPASPAWRSVTQDFPEGVHVFVLAGAPKRPYRLNAVSPLHAQRRCVVGEFKNHDDEDVKDWMFVAVCLPLVIMFVVVVVIPALT